MGAKMKSWYKEYGIEQQFRGDVHRTCIEGVRQILIDGVVSRRDIGSVIENVMEWLRFCNEKFGIKR